MADTIPPTDAPAATDAALPEQDKKKGPGIAGLAAAAAAGTAGATLTAGALHEKAIEWKHDDRVATDKRIIAVEKQKYDAEGQAVTKHAEKHPYPPSDDTARIERWQEAANNKAAKAAKPYTRKIGKLSAEVEKLTAGLEKLEAVKDEGFLKKAGAVFSHGGGKAAGSAVLLGATIAVPVAFLVKEARNHGSHADRVAASQQADASQGASR